ncbi:DUF4233 domain-containing protein [Catelliglobosispora koreensis]|uniref:DUF4233 domain-containing protein n=1 Tax=Catelliglobosispora koreensis TaxID=129052 RepID=UPI001FDF0C03|nr:DUF4233 domain-containing protein [Catelliglobosispora koreensis]
MSTRPSKDRVARPVNMSFGGKPSGLRNPSSAMRGLGAITLTMEALVLLLAILPIRTLEEGISNAQLVVTAGGAVAAMLCIGLLRKPIGWRLVLVLQAFFVLCGFLHWMIGAVGVTFGLAWLYVLYVRRRVLL